MNFLFNRNKTFLVEIRHHFGPVRVQIMEIGDGLLAIKTKEDFDTIFDTGRWKLTITVKESHRAIVFPPTLVNAGILPGKLMGGVADREKVMQIVRQKLARLADHYQLVEEKREKMKKKDPKSRPSDDPFGFHDFSDLFKAFGGDNSPFEDFFKKR
jgi:hypothetical protein